MAAAAHLRSFEPEGPPEEIEEIGEAMHTCEDQLVGSLPKRSTVMLDAARW